MQWHHVHIPTSTYTRGLLATLKATCRSTRIRGRRWASVLGNNGIITNCWRYWWLASYSSYSYSSYSYDCRCWCWCRCGPPCALLLGHHHLLVLLALLPITRNLRLLRFRTYRSHRSHWGIPNLSNILGLLCRPCTLDVLSIVGHTLGTSHAIVVEILPNAVIIDIVAFRHPKIPEVHASLRSHLLARVHDCRSVLLLIPSVVDIHFLFTTCPVLPIASLGGLSLPFHLHLQLGLLGHSRVRRITHAIIHRLLPLNLDLALSWGLTLSLPLPLPLPGPSMRTLAPRL